MNKTAWVTVVVVAVVFAGGGYYVGAKAQTSPAPTSRFSGGGGATFVGRGGGGFGGGGGATIGTILQVGNGSITLQLPNSTSTTATTGTKIVLVGSQTQVQELQSVPVSSLSVGQTITVNGTANSDGSVTANSIQVLPAGVRRPGTSTQ
ncbi:MAG TPA: hypothetical protein VMH91_04025 [Candidatus Paceibacterota bacterium]|nr:hypothetical protein [Candidatus Paceibacterota bacterium]